jgi:hypothetical protein
MDPLASPVPAKGAQSGGTPRVMIDTTHFEIPIAALVLVIAYAFR